MSQDFTLFKQRLSEAGYDFDAIEQILEVAKNSIYPKKYGLVWEEKPEIIKENLKLQIPYLEELKEREIKLSEPNSPQHLLIEGDNYEALKLLQTTHRGKVNVIYIDPPYNTGNNDFIYNDRIVDKEDSYRHSKWLSFMHKRLILAKELMSEDGVIFISIDDNEFAQLKLLCDEIFGEKNFLNCAIWNKKRTQGRGATGLIDWHEYVLIYAKNKMCKKNFFKTFKSEKQKKDYKYCDECGPYRLLPFEKSGNSEQSRPNCVYPIKCDDGTDIWPRRQWWRWGKNTYEENKHLIVFKKIKTGEIVPYTKDYLFKDGSESLTIPPSIIEGFYNSEGTNTIKELFGKVAFNNSKPVELLKHLISINNDKHCIILDFFAGSGTTGHATLELNKEDGGNRQFILCTNNENNICEEVTYERLKRIINGYTTSKGKENEGLPANLKYLKVGLVEKETYTDEDLSYLYIPHVLPLLQLKHNTHRLVTQSEHAFVYENESFRFGVATDLASEKEFDLLVNSLKDFQGDKVLYLFSTDTHSYPKHQHLSDLEGIIQPIPREILNLLKGE